jgi:hypothetical protein
VGEAGDLQGPQGIHLHQTPCFSRPGPFFWADTTGNIPGSAPRPAGVWRRAGTCHNADSPRTVAMTILPTQGLAAWFGTRRYTKSKRKPRSFKHRGSRWEHSDLEGKTRRGSHRARPAVGATHRRVRPGHDAQGCWARHDHLTNATLAASFGTQNCYLAMAAMRAVADVNDGPRLPIHF